MPEQCAVQSRRFEINLELVKGSRRCKKISLHQQQQQLGKLERKTNKQVSTPRTDQQTTDFTSFTFLIKTHWGIWLSAEWLTRVDSPMPGEWTPCWSFPNPSTSYPSHTPQVWTAPLSPGWTASGGKISYKVDPSECLVMEKFEVHRTVPYKPGKKGQILGGKQSRSDSQLSKRTSKREKR